MTATTSLHMDDATQGNDPDKRREYDEVKAWTDRYADARTFDEAPYRQYAIDRRYSRGDSAYDVDVPLIATFIDISASFLYAKQPDVEVVASQAANAPGPELIAEAAAEVAKVEGEKAGRAATAQTLAQAVSSGLSVQEAIPLGTAAGQTAEQVRGAEALVQAMEAITKHYQQRQRDAKALAETLELLLTHKWKKAKLKKRGRRMVRSALNVGTGILKVTFQHRTKPSPQTRAQIRDLQTNIARIATLARELAGPESAHDKAAREAKETELQEQLATLKAMPEQTILRDLVIEVVRPENLTIAPGYALADAEEAPWQIERIPTRLKAAKDAFPDITEEQWGKATRYQARKPEPLKYSQPATPGSTSVDPKDADGFTVGEREGGGEAYVMVLECWDAEANLVRTWVEGIACWAKEAWTPPATSRFYPYFLLCIGETGEERHPVSLVTRSAKLINEYNRIVSQERKHRKRCLPKMAFNGAALSEPEAKKLAKADAGEMVALKFTDPSIDIQKILKEVAYPAWNPALYDKSSIRNDLETLWGIQEALSGGVEVAKTATEADIQQQGFSSRTGDRREDLDTLLNELGPYCAELFRACLTPEEVAVICGPQAYWPPYTGPDTDALRMVTVDIVAGSSGKPNSAKEREDWGIMLPVLQEGINTVGTLRMSLPADMADAHAKVIALTAEKLGMRLAIDDMLPKAPPVLPTPGVPGAPGAPAPGGPPADPNAPAPAPGAPAPAPEAVPA